uniref:Uncharacterized protein n=1 Tax=Caenorhabditis japonica TaxID=281687 RepID=A0A8R1EEA9_CAEJA
MIPSSPSMVLRVVIPVEENREISITQLYSNDGATISTATLAVRSGRSRFINISSNSDNDSDNYFLNLEGGEFFVEVCDVFIQFFLFTSERLTVCFQLSSTQLRI